MSLVLKLRGVRPDRIVQVLGVVVAVLGGSVSVVGAATDIQRALWISTFVILGVFICFMVFVQTEQAAEDQRQLRLRIDDLKSAAEESTRLQTVNNALQKRLLDLTQINARLADEAKQAVTGGDSFCYTNANFQFDKPFFIIMQSGRYPVYDVLFKILDLSSRSSMSDPGKIIAEATLTVLNVGGTAHGPEFPEPFSGSDTRRFQIVFIARNGTWSENLALHRGKHKWSCALRVWPKKTNPPEMDQKPVFQHIDDDFPRNANGDVDWW